MHHQAQPAQENYAGCCRSYAWYRAPLSTPGGEPGAGASKEVESRLWVCFWVCYMPPEIPENAPKTADSSYTNFRDSGLMQVQGQCRMRQRQSMDGDMPEAMSGRRGGSARDLPPRTLVQFS